MAWFKIEFLHIIFVLFEARIPSHASESELGNTAYSIECFFWQESLPTWAEKAVNCGIVVSRTLNDNVRPSKVDFLL